MPKGPKLTAGDILGLGANSVSRFTRRTFGSLLPGWVPAGLTAVDILKKIAEGSYTAEDAASSAGQYALNTAINYGVNTIAGGLGLGGATSGAVRLGIGLAAGTSSLSTNQAVRRLVAENIPIPIPIPTASTCLAEAAWYPGDKALEVTFTDGSGPYQYPCSAKTALGLATATSQGGYFNLHIRS